MPFKENHRIGLKFQIWKLETVDKRFVERFLLKVPPGGVMPLRARLPECDSPSRRNTFIYYTSS